MVAAVLVIVATLSLVAYTVYVGFVRDIEVTEDGHLFVSDAFWDSVLEFNSAGEPVRRFGRHGLEPGELQGAGAIEVTDSLVIVDDALSGVLSAFRREDGGLLHRHEHGQLVSSLTSFGEGLLVGARGMDGVGAAAYWPNWHEGWSPFAPLPPDLVGEPTLAQVFHGTYVAIGPGGIAVGHSGSGWVYDYEYNLVPIDSLFLPSRDRLGVPTGKPGKRPTIAQRSALFFLGRLHNGALVLVHHDLDVDGRRMTGVAYVSVVSADRRRACIDTRLPLTLELGLGYDMVGDTLAILARSSEGDS